MKTRTEIIEGNKLIAGFMGWTKRGCDYLYPREFYYLYQPYNIYEFEGGQYNYEEDETGLKFNSSWDWLMPVVEKIYNTGISGGIVAGLRESLFNVNIEQVHKCVIEFIQWHNNRQSKL